MPSLVTILTLPCFLSCSVLILHLKRFRFTAQYSVEKVTDVVHLNQDLVVTSTDVSKMSMSRNLELIKLTLYVYFVQGTGLYTLKGVISHVGECADAGMYLLPLLLKTTLP